MLELTVDEPRSGAFTGGDTVLVAGSINDPEAELWVEGEPIGVDRRGRFEAEVPIDGAWRILDVVALNPRSESKERIPVFSGSDPMEAWPGGTTMRLTTAGLADLGDLVGASLDATGWQAGLETLIPGSRVESAPIEMALVPTAGGVDMQLLFAELRWSFDVELPLFGTTPITVAFSELSISALASPEVDDDGVLWLAIADTSFVLDAPDIDVGALDLALVDEATALALGLVADLGLWLAELLLADGVAIGALGDTEIDLLGTTVSMGLAELLTDVDGLGLGLDMVIEDIDAAPDGVPVPDAVDDADLVLGIHEGLFQLVLTSDLVDLLDQDMRLSGFLADILTLPLLGLPGGSALPTEATEWCLYIDPGDARAVRMHEGLDPIATFYLPDLDFDVRYSTIDSICEPWIHLSMALEADIRLEEGDLLTFDLSVVEGVVYHYMTPVPWEEEEVIDGLGDLLEATLGLLGGSLEVDLSELAGTETNSDELGALSLEVISSTPLTRGGKPTVDGLYSWALSLWE